MDAQILVLKQLVVTLMAIIATLQAQHTAPVANIAPQTPQIATTTTFVTPSGAVIDQNGSVVSTPVHAVMELHATTTPIAVQPQLPPPEYMPAGTTPSRSECLSPSVRYKTNSIAWHRCHATYQDL